MLSDECRNHDDLNSLISSLQVLARLLHQTGKGRDELNNAQIFMTKYGTEKTGTATALPSLHHKIAHRQLINALIGIFTGTW